MQHSYSVSFMRLCPVDDTTVRYELLLTSEQKIMAEDIVEAVSGSTATLQEDLAEHLSDTFVLASGRLTAAHGPVKIMSQWEPM